MTALHHRSHRMDDRLWYELWERNLSKVERRNVAVDVWRRQRPDDHFVALVGWELAHRWRARARNLAVLYLLWSTFWAAVTWAIVQRPEPGEFGLSLFLTGAGVIGIALCFMVRRRMRPVVDGSTGFIPAGANQSQDLR